MIKKNKVNTGFTQHHFHSSKLSLNSKETKSSAGLPSTSSGAGFTLLEAVFAISILLIGLVAIVQFFPFAAKIIGDSQSLTTTSNLALAKIEELKSSSYDELTVGTIEAKHRLSSDPSSYLYQYQRQTVIETVNGNLDPSGSDIGLKKITVTVFWHSRIGSQEKSNQIYTLISDY